MMTTCGSFVRIASDRPAAQTVSTATWGRLIARKALVIADGARLASATRRHFTRAGTFATNSPSIAPHSSEATPRQTHFLPRPLEVADPTFIRRRIMRSTSWPRHQERAGSSRKGFPENLNVRRFHDQPLVSNDWKPADPMSSSH
jgi:hypothetical protein